MHILKKILHHLNTKAVYRKTPDNEDDNNNIVKGVKIVVPLKHLCNFWRALDMPQINCEINLILTWSENCVLTDLITHAVVPAQLDVPARSAKNAPEDSTFKITDTKLYVPVVTLSTQDDNKLLEQLKTGFKRTIKRNKYRSEMTNQTKTDNLNYLIDPTFSKVNIVFVLSFENEKDRTSYSKYYIPKIEEEDFNILIDGKSFFDTPIKNKEETYEKIIKMSRNSDYTTGNLLDYEYFSNHYKLIAVNLSKQTELGNLDIKQQINFIGRLDENNTTMFFIIEKSEETTFQYSQNFVSIIKNGNKK